MSEQAPNQWLPKLVEPRKLVVTSASFQRFIRAEDLPRLAESAREVRSVWVDVTFDRDEQGRPMLTGQVRAELELECQRCLESMSYSVEEPITLAIVWDEAQAKALPKHLEPWIVADDEAELPAIIEEELILHLPVVARHEQDCLDSAYLSSDEQEEDAPTAADSPFSVLSKLKGKP